MKFKTLVGKNIKVNYEEIYRVLSQNSDNTLLNSIDFLLYGDEYFKASKDVKDYMFTKQEQKFIKNSIINNWSGGAYVFEKLYDNVTEWMDRKKKNTITMNISYRDYIDIFDNALEYIVRMYITDSDLEEYYFEKANETEQLELVMNLDLARIFLHEVNHIKSEECWNGNYNEEYYVDMLAIMQLKEYVKNYGTPKLINILDTKQEDE